MSLQVFQPRVSFDTILKLNEKKQNAELTKLIFQHKTELDICHQAIEFELAN